MSHTGRRLVVACLLVASAVSAGGCDTGDEAAREAPSPSSPSSASASASASASMPSSPAPATSASAPWTSFKGPLKRCGPQPPSVVAAPFDHTVLRDPGVGTIPAVRLGDGPVALVLLHQTDGNGLCGWLPFMPTLAQAGYSVLAIDLCQYGRSDCRAVTEGRFTDADQTGPVAVATSYARSGMGAQRVVVAGASMGGSVALMSAATLPGIDTAVDLSGPVDWAGMDVVRSGAALPVPVLVAMATSEGPEQVAGAREIVGHAPAGSKLLTPEAGHGYALLNDVEGGVLPPAADVLDWLEQQQPPR